MLPVLWRAKARASLVQIIGYIADRNPIAAQRLKDAIEVIHVLHSRQQYP